MKILLDECLPLDFRHCFQDYHAHTAEWAGFKGIKNGQLLREAEGAGYAVFLTTDKGILHQQNLAGRRMSIILIRSRTNKIEDLLPAVDAIIRELRIIEPSRLSVVSGLI